MPRVRPLRSQTLDLVRAAAYDALVAHAAGVRERAKSLTAAAEQIATDEPAAGAWEAAYGRAKELARFALRRTPEAQRDLDLDRPSEPAITWWSAECGGIDAPQPASESASGAQSSGSTPLATARAA